MYGTVATLYKFTSWLQMGVKIKCRTDKKGLESWVKEDVDCIGGPVVRRSCWQQFRQGSPWRLSTSRGKTTGRRMCFLKSPYRINLFWG